MSKSKALPRMKLRNFIKRIAPIVIAVSVIIYIIIPSHIVTPSNTLTPYPSKTIELKHSINIYRSYPLNHGILSYFAILPKYWDRDPTTLSLGIFIIRNDTPWYARGYSIKASSIKVSIDGLPYYVSRYYIHEEGVTVDRKGYTLKIRIYLGGYLARKYNATLHVAVKVKITEWSILGPLKTFEEELLNTSIPIIIDIKYVCLEGILYRLYSG